MPKETPYYETLDLEEIRQVLEFIDQAAEGLITAGEMAVKIEDFLGCKFETEVA